MLGGGGGGGGGGLEAVSTSHPSVCCSHSAIGLHTGLYLPIHCSADTEYIYMTSHVLMHAYSCADGSV